MSFYKIIQDSTIIGVCTDNDFRRWQSKHNIIIVSDRDKVEAVDYNGTLYHDSWMADSGHIPYETASVREITEAEYSNIKAQLDDGEFPDDGSLDEETEVPVDNPNPDQGEGETVRKTTAQLLMEQIRNLENQIRQADPDADMIADSNIVSGQFFTSGNTLYKATANIASGTAIFVGKNAVRKPISEALNEINA